jgi:hypothetical protein
MPNYNPEPLEFAVKDFHPHQYNFGVAKSDGIYMGRMLMKNEVLSLIKAAYPVPTKAIARIIEIVDNIEIYVDPANNISSR